MKQLKCCCHFQSALTSCTFVLVVCFTTTISCHYLLATNFDQDFLFMIKPRRCDVKNFDQEALFILHHLYLEMIISWTVPCQTNPNTTHQTQMLGQDSLLDRFSYRIGLIKTQGPKDNSRSLEMCFHAFNKLICVFLQINILNYTFLLFFNKPTRKFDLTIC